MAKTPLPDEHGETQQFLNLGALLKKYGKQPVKYIEELERDRNAISSALLNPCRFVEERIEQKMLDPTGEYAQKKQELAERVARGEITTLEENLLRFAEGLKLVEKDFSRREEHIDQANQRFKENEKIFNEKTAAGEKTIEALESRIKALSASTALQQSAMDETEQDKQALRGHYARARLSTLASLFDAYARLNPAAEQSHDDEGGAAPSMNTAYVNFLKRCSEQLGKETKGAVVVWVGNPDRGTQPVEESLQNLVLADTDKVDAFVHAEVLRLSSHVMQGYAGMQRLQGEKIAEHKAMAAQHHKELEQQHKNARRDKVLHYLRWRTERAALQHEIAQLTKNGEQASDAYNKLDALYQGVFKEKESLAAKYTQIETDYRKLAEDRDTLDVLLGTATKQAEDDKKHFTAQHASLEKQVVDKDKELEHLRDTYEKRIAAMENRERLVTDAAKDYIKSREEVLAAEITETHRRQEALTQREQELVTLRAQLEDTEGKRKTTFGYLARVLAGRHKEYEAGIAERKKVQALLMLQMKVNDAKMQGAYRMLEQAGLLPGPQSSYDGPL